MHRMSILPTQKIFGKLVQACAKAGNPTVAKSLFQVMQHSDLKASVNVLDCAQLIQALGTSDGGELKNSMEVLDFMDKQKITPNAIVYNCLLTVCANFANLAEGQKVHGHMTQHNIPFNTQLQTSLMNMYFKCGSPLQAAEIFSQMQTRDVVTWNCMLSGYLAAGYPSEVIQMFKQMDQLGIQPTVATFSLVLKACSDVQDLPFGRNLHTQLTNRQLDNNFQIQLELLNMYSKCEDMKAAKSIFKLLHNPGTSAWNTLISGYVNCGQYKHAIQEFKHLQSLSVPSDDVTCHLVITACTEVGEVEVGKQIYESHFSTSTNINVKLGTSLIQFLSLCGCMETASSVLSRIHSPDVVAYNELISGYIKNKQFQNAIVMFHKMKDAKVDSDVVSWNALMHSHRSDENARKALELFYSLKKCGISPNEYSYAIAMSACTDKREWLQGMNIYKKALKAGWGNNIYVAVAALTMYSRASFLKEAIDIYSAISEKSVGAYNAMIAAYGHHSYISDALALFDEMLSNRIQPDDITFVSIVSALSHAGMPDKAVEYYDTMETQFKITPTVDHANAVIDGLARADRLEEAEAFVSRTVPNLVTWATLLSGYRTKKDIVNAKRVGANILAMNPTEVSVYVIWCEILSALGHHEEAEHIRAFMKQHKLYKLPGRTTLHIGGMEYKFCVGDKSNPRWRDMEEEGRRVQADLLQHGIPQVSSVSFTQ